MNIFSNIDIREIDNLLVETNKEIISIKDNLFKLDDYIENKFKKIFFLFIENSKESILFYYQIIKANHVPILLSPDLDQNSIDILLNKYKPNYILSLKKLELIKNKYRNIKNFNKYLLYEENKKNNHNPHKDLCLLMSASGTTGSPKFVKISYENIYENTHSICKFLKIKSDDTIITTLQPNYTYGLSILNTHINMRAKIILNNNSIIEKNFWKKIDDFKVSTFGGVAFTYEMLQRIKFEKISTPSLQYITHAGGKLTPNLHKYILKICKIKSLKFISMYGQTEATSRISYLPWKYSNKKISSIGRAIPSGTLFIKGKKDKGEICYKGKNIMIGYAHDYKDLTKKEIIKTLYTGDYGHKDKDGFFYVDGRKDRYIKLFGHRINLDEIDYYLRDNGFITATIFNDNKFTVFYEGDYNINDIEKKITDKLKITKKYILIKKIKNIPMSNSGKIRFSKLK